MAHVFILGSIDDVETLMALPPIPPHQIHVVSIDSVRRAPEYLAAVEDKITEGWACTTTPRLARFSRFANILTALQDNIIPELANNPTNRQALRRLRSRGQAVRHLRQGAMHEQPLLVRLTGLFSNSLERVARKALTDVAYDLSDYLLGVIAGRVKLCLDYAVTFPEVDPGSGDDSSDEPSSSGGSDDKGGAK